MHKYLTKQIVWDIKPDVAKNNGFLSLCRYYSDIKGPLKIIHQIYNVLNNVPNNSKYHTLH